RWDVERDDAEVAEPRLDVAPFLVERLPAQRGADLVRLAPGVDGHAAVALLRGGVAEPGLVAGGQELRPRELVLLGLGFLDAEDVGVLRGEPVEESLAGRRAQAVGVEAGDAHGPSVSFSGS